LADDQGALAVAQSWGERDQCGLRLTDQQHDSVIAQAVTQRAPLFSPSSQAGDASPWRLADCAALVMPLLAQDLTLGLIAVQDADPETKLGPSQQDFVSSVASQLAIAIENARLYAEVRGFNAALEQRIAERTHELQIERDMLSTLNQIALEINSTLDLDLLLASSLQVFANLIGVERGSIMLIEEDTYHLVDRAVLGRSRDQVGYTRFPVGHGIAGWVAQHRKPALVPDVSQDERWVELPENELGRKRVGAMALVPLVVQGEVTGVMSLSHDQVGYFNEDHMRLLGASAETIALGINNARLYDEISRESVRRGDMVQKERSATTQSSAILQSLSDGVIVCNEYGGVITANPAAERVLGIPLEDLLLMPLPDLLRKLLMQRAKELPIEAALEGRSTLQSYATKFQRGRYTIRVTLDPVVTERGQTIGALAVFRDITREVESERLKDEFIGTVSHELRTPMTSIKGFTQLLAMGSLGPINAQQKEFLSTIQTNAERMISIINDLLDITKIEAGSVELEIRPVHMAEALGNVIVDVRPQIDARQHELHITIPPGLPLVRVDAKRFDQILGHLLNNAIKYTPVGGKITFVASELDRATLPPAVAEQILPGRYVQIDVSDTGLGIAVEEQELVFERFYRTENQLKIEAGGTGLGLSLVRPLVKLFGGQIWLRSFIDEGSTFSFVVPAV
ncbi:MAG: GAF domain-containing protein, partial [Roseiflexaceae bacterium]|nr:GAF domain-containing protein [Roseiflexaceae bacterium]